MFPYPSIKARQLEQARKNRLIVRNMALFVVVVPVLWGAACVLEHRKMSWFSDKVDAILKSNPKELTKDKVRSIMDGPGSRTDFKLQPEIRESVIGESGDRAIYPADGEAFCQWPMYFDPGMMAMCIHVAYDKSDRVLWTYSVLLD
jgi:hypothetical protein